MSPNCLSSSYLKDNFLDSVIFVPIFLPSEHWRNCSVISLHERHFRPAFLLPPGLRVIPGTQADRVILSVAS